MPKLTVSAEKMTENGAHWTKAQISARQMAAEATRRKNRVTLKPPEWLSDEAVNVWKQVKKQLKGIELLDTLDTHMLAVYCDAIVKYKACSVLPMSDPENMKSVQAWARIISSYAEKLGFTPGGRARLAKKRAEKPIDEFGDTFD